MSGDRLQFIVRPIVDSLHASSAVPHFLRPLTGLIILATYMSYCCREASCRQGERGIIRRCTSNKVETFELSELWGCHVIFIF